jgi:cell division protein ZapA
MNTATKNLTTVKIFDRDYRISCDKDGEADLHKAARYLDQQMREIRETSKVMGAERIAIMAALNIAHEYLQQDCDNNKKTEFDKRLRNMQQKIEILLNQNSQLEL